MFSYIVIIFTKFLSFYKKLKKTKFLSNLGMLSWKASFPSL